MAQATLTSSTTQATTSGATVTFTGIPAWAKRVTIALNSVSLSGAGYVLAQLGAGAVQNTGYSSFTTQTQAAASQTVNATAGFVVDGGAATVVMLGTITLTNIGNNTWVASLAGGAVNSGNFRSWVGGGVVTLSGALDRIVLASSLADTFDQGSAAVFWE